MSYVDLIRNNKILQAGARVEVEYRLDLPEYAVLKEKYDFPWNGAEKDSVKIFQILQWVNTHIQHTGNYANSERQDAITLLQLAYDKDFGINCLSMSIVLCECLLAAGIRARVMYMMPAAADDGDNHVVVEAYASDLGKWIMTDPTYGCYCCDKNGVILNLYEMRDFAAKEETYFFSDSMNYNGQVVEDLEDAKNYYAKNLFFLRCKSIQGYGQHVLYGDMLEFAPQEFDVHERMVKNLAYRIENFGDCELLQCWKKYEENLKNVYANIEVLYL